MYKIDGISYLIQLPCDLIALIRHRGYSNYDRKKKKKKEVINRVNRFPDILAKKKKKKLRFTTPTRSNILPITTTPISAIEDGTSYDLITTV